ncbi:MAG TPA: hypothetical protein VGJ04_01075 [Pirellulales bacterium]|jgi:hypothetical protein
MREDLPAGVAQFIAQHIESLSQLEVLLYARQNADRQLHPNEIANRLALTAEMSAGILADLVRRGLAVKAEACFRYHSDGGEVDRTIDLLAETYRVRRLAVTNEIYSKPLGKVKSFASAFRLRKEE